ncbi:MAG TPA: ThiF family adenylyltransferase [Chloroflexia bacterium]|nr:ThiF family adenylyltransferase [Chloroflexia bacterium]
MQETSNGLERYIRQTIFRGVGVEGQRKLLAAHALIVGCGALGTAIANLVARAGIGHITIIDRDFIELNNLQRQTLYDEADLEQNLPKAVAAAQKLRLINSEITVEAIVEDLNYENVEKLVAAADIVLDGTDNFETRYLLNDVCVKLNKPWIYSGVIASYGVSSTIIPGESPCYRCLFPEAPPPGTTPTCDTAGIVGPIVGMMGAMAAGEAIKLITGQGKLNRGLLSIDLWQLTFDRLPVETRQPDCPCCAQRNFEYLEAAGDIGSRAASLCGRNAVQVTVRPIPELNIAEVARRMASAGAQELQENEYLLRFKLDGYDWTLFPDARAIIKGTDDLNAAKTLYARYVGI